MSATAQTAGLIVGSVEGDVLAEQRDMHTDDRPMEQLRQAQAAWHASTTASLHATLAIVAGARLDPAYVASLQAAMAAAREACEKAFELYRRSMPVGHPQLAGEALRHFRTLKGAAWPRVVTGQRREAQAAPPTEDHPARHLGETYWRTVNDSRPAGSSAKPASWCGPGPA